MRRPLIIKWKRICKLACKDAHADCSASLCWRQRSAKRHLEKGDARKEYTSGFSASSFPQKSLFPDAPKVFASNTISNEILDIALDILPRLATLDSHISPHFSTNEKDRPPSLSGVHCSIPCRFYQAVFTSSSQWKITMPKTKKTCVEKFSRNRQNNCFYSFDMV